jgi:alkylation response protein AidB-like acyl-CoA dehydrogenase
MDVVLSEEEQMVLSAAREFFEAEASPRLARAMEKEEPGYSTDLWSKLAELGWTGVSIPERYGGQGLPLVYLGLVLQEAGRAIAPVPLLSTAIAALTIAEAGSEELQQEILPRVSTGDVVLSFAFQEEDPRLFVPDTIQMHAEQNGDEYVLSGTKMFVDNFSIADYCLVPCRTLEPSGVREGISLFLVDTTSPGIVDTPLVTLAKDKQSRVSFDRVRVPREHVVGPIDGGWPVIQQALDRAVPLLRNAARRFRAPCGRLPVGPAHRR